MGKNNKNNEEKTYMGEGMLWGVVAGSIIGTIIAIFANATYLVVCISVGMLFGLAIGSSIKKDKSSKNHRN